MASITDFDKWETEYKTSTEKHAYEMVLQAVGQTVPKDFSEPFTMSLLEIKDLLIFYNLLDEAIDLINKIKTKQPAIYKKDFPYFENFSIIYYLYKKDTANLAKVLDQFVKNPEECMDYLFSIINDLIFYGHTDLAVDICKKVYEPVKNAEKILYSAELELSEAIFLDLMDQIYKKVKAKKDIDWDKLAKELDKYDFIGQKVVEDIKPVILNGIKDEKEAEKLFKKSHKSFLEDLAWEFGKYMHDEKNMDFACSQIIYSSFLASFPQKKKADSIDKFFIINEEDFDGYLGELFGDFMAMEQSKAIAVLWGSIYVYDFLLAKKMISTETYKDALEKIKSLQTPILTEPDKSFWRYHFIYRWTRPDGTSEKDFSNEAKILTDTINMKEQLSSDKIKENLFDKFMDGVEDINIQVVEATKPKKKTAVKSTTKPAVKSKAKAKPKKSAK